VAVAMVEVKALMPVCAKQVAANNIAITTDTV
jgi:hypothetical protein